MSDFESWWWNNHQDQPKPKVYHGEPPVWTEVHAGDVIMKRKIGANWNPNGEEVGQTVGSGYIVGGEKPRNWEFNSDKGLVDTKSDSGIDQELKEQLKKFEKRAELEEPSPDEILGKLNA